MACSRKVYIAGAVSLLCAAQSVGGRSQSPTIAVPACGLRAVGRALAAALPLCRVGRLFRRFGFIPETVHLRESDLGGTLAVCRQGAFDLRKSEFKFPVC